MLWIKYKMNWMTTTNNPKYVIDNNIILKVTV